MTTASVRRDPASDEEFLAQLYKGGELLAAGKVIEAKDHLERAYQLHPKNEKAQNLLGLTYFKLGLFERASGIYEQLVNENPVDPTLRVNLGLVYLKTNNLQKSVREFETATDLDPGHKKAHNYLGLALAQAGDYARAREHFVISGSDAMADKMAKAMVSAQAPATVSMTPTEALPPLPEPPQPPPPPAVTAPPPPSPAGREEVQIEMMSEEEDVPPEVDPGAAPSPSALMDGPPSASALMEEAQSLGGAGGPPLPQPGFEELPAAAAPPPPPPGASPPADWGAQFGIEPPAAAQDEQPVAPEEIRFADDEGPSAATSEAAVATGMQVPSSVMESPPAEEPAMVAAIAVEATVEEVPVSAETDWTTPPSTSQDEDWTATGPSSAPSAEAEWVPEPAAAELPPAREWSEPAHEEAAAEPTAPDPMSAEPMSAEPMSGEQMSGEQMGAEQMSAEPAAEETWAPPPESQEAAEPPPPRPSAPEVQPGFQAISVPKLADLGPRLDYRPGPTTIGPFHVGPEGLAVMVNGEMLSRLHGLVAVAGTVDAAPEMRRTRGRATGEPFGEGTKQLQRVTGYGTMYLEPGKGHFQAIDLDDEGCYLREERVFAFEEPVAFENGQLSAQNIVMALVHLKGQGRVLLKLDGPLKSMAVPAGSPLKVPLVRLVGWYGRITPRVMGFVGQSTVELTGEGYALLSAPG